MTKAAKYTTEMTTEMTFEYGRAQTETERNATVAALAKKFGRSIPEIRSKLVHLGVYIAATVKRKAKPRVTKMARATALGSRLNLGNGAVKSLAGTTFEVLNAFEGVMNELDRAEEVLSMVDFS